MPQDYYDEEASGTMPEKPAKAEEKDNSDSEALLPKSFFQGKELEPGSECKIKVVKILDDEVIVSYVPHDEGKDESEESEPAMAMESESKDNRYE